MLEDSDGVVEALADSVVVVDDPAADVLDHAGGNRGACGLCHGS